MRVVKDLRLNSLRVELFVDFLEMRVGHMGIDLSRRDIGVTEEGLDRAKIGAVH